MYKKNLNFESVIFKVFFTYLVVYLLGVSDFGNALIFTVILVILDDLTIPDYTLSI